MSTANAPSSRCGALALAMRGKMFVWGGTDGITNSLGEQTYLSDGGIFDAETNTWASISKVGSPTLTAQNGVWAEEQGLIYVWAFIPAPGAGSPGVALWTYDPSADRWASIDVTYLQQLESPSFVWTGLDLLAIGHWSYELAVGKIFVMEVYRYTP
jgi:hypothetical protein